MSIYAIADTHLSFFPGADKPMGVFGPRWENHEERLKKAWKQTVGAEDTVVIAGDISWGMKLEEARYDLDWIHALPGRKILIKGNHDLWWSSIKKLNSLYDDMRFIQNDCVMVDDICICGTRGWITPDHEDFDEADEKIYKREVLRLEMSLEAGKKAIEDNGGEGRMIGFLHYPPAAGYSFRSGFQELFIKYGVRNVYYGHIHGEDGARTALQGESEGVRYRLISLDHMDCRPAPVAE